MKALKINDDYERETSGATVGYLGFKNTRQKGGLSLTMKEKHPERMKMTNKNEATNDPE